MRPIAKPANSSGLRPPNRNCHVNANRPERGGSAFCASGLPGAGRAISERLTDLESVMSFTVDARGGVLPLRQVQKARGYPIRAASQATARGERL